MYSEPLTPFCLSRGNLRSWNFFCALTDQAKQLLSNVAFEAMDRLQLEVTVSDSAGDIGLRTRISATQSSDNDV